MERAEAERGSGVSGRGAPPGTPPGTATAACPVDVRLQRTTEVPRVGPRPRRPPALASTEQSAGRRHMPSPGHLLQPSPSPGFVCRLTTSTPESLGAPPASAILRPAQAGPGHPGLFGAANKQHRRGTEGLPSRAQTRPGRIGSYGRTEEGRQWGAREGARAGVCVGHFLPAWVTKAAAGSSRSADVGPTVGSGPAWLLLARR